MQSLVCANDQALVKKLIKIARKRPKITPGTIEWVTNSIITVSAFYFSSKRQRITMSYKYH